KHVFQDLEDFTKYTNPDGSVGKEGELITTQNGNTGSTMEVSPLTEKDSRRKGFVPERESIIMQVPENAENFILEYRYNRAHYDVTFDTQGGTEIPARTLYYEQVIPKIADESIPTKVGGEFQGWKPSVDLTTKDGKTFKANEIIKAGTDAIKNLDANLIMPASKVTFTAVWKDKPQADYAVQFWAEKADHADGVPLADKYDYIGTRVYKDQDTGMRPDLDNEPVKDIVFPDLDKARLNKIWANAKFNRGKDLYLNKFYVYNQALTHDQNKDQENANLVKSVDATGKTVYNIYYDRQVYDLYFTKSNYLPAENTFYPEIWGYDEAKGEVVKKGGPGNPYHYKARFNQLMLGWPNDAMQTKGFSKGMQSFGWGPNYNTPYWPLHLDTPPYRLNADEFLDMSEYDNKGGYTKKIDKGDGTSKKLDWSDFKTLSFGIKQAEKSMPHHMDFWMDGFKDGEKIIRYDLYRYKADTNSETYAPSYPKVQGFTGKRTNETPEYLESDGIDEKNDERADVTPFPAKTYTDMYGDEHAVGEMPFIKTFFNNTDEFGDSLDGNSFDTNGYLKFEYTRDKYPLRFNYDPSKIKGDSEFGKTNSLDTFYEFPLKVLSPDLVDNDTEREDREYFKKDPKNFLDNPENLQKLELTDLVFTDPKDNKLKVKRPEGLSDQMVFKGWALDPAGTKLIWENPGEKMPNHPVNLYAKWGEPDFKWKVTFDPNGGNLRNIKEKDLTTSSKKIEEGDIGQEEVNTYAKKGYLKEKPTTPDGKQVFTVIQRQKLVQPPKPIRKGYDFMGWEVIHYKKDAKTGDYTTEQDTSYKDTYKVPELYSFGNDVVAPVYLKAIWVPNARVDVKVVHYMLDKDYKLKKKLEDTLEDKRANYLVAATGDRQDDEYILATQKELEENLQDDLKTEYEAYNKRIGLNNTFFQTFRVEPEKIDDGSGKLIPNPKVEDNVFKFFYKPFRTRQYKVNYIDERFKGKETQEGAAIIDQEPVENGNRHYDARNYRQIPGWKLVSAPQQQLFFDVDEDTNEFKGINGTGKDEITFYYKDVRVIEVPGDKEPPEGYVRVTFKAENGGSFTDKSGKPVKELHYDVIEGLKSDLLPVPQELKDGEEKVADKYYITPETGKKFVEWYNSPLLNRNTIIDKNHTFTAKFEWSGLSASGLVRTEAFKDLENKWTNNFAPTIQDLKKQLVWREKDQVKPIPDGTDIKFINADGNELKTDEDIFKLVNEKNKADKEQLFRTVNVKAKVNFKDGKETQELDIPITVYKNVYEALNKDGDKPLFLTEAEGKDAKDGGLKDVTGNYVKVTVQPTEKNTNKDAKVYYVNPKAWVNIPEVEWSQDDKDKTDFLKWTADKKDQNENKEENGIFDFSKRHKFTNSETLIKPLFTNDVVKQKEGEDKPKVPDNFVKVIVKTTDKATTVSTQTFWVNPTKEVNIPVAEPKGKTDQEVEITGLGKKKVNYVFKEWQKVKTGEADDKLTEVNPAVKIELAKNKYTDKVTVIEAAYKKSIQAEPIVEPLKTTKLDTPQGKEITDKDLIKQITPQEGKEIASIEVVSKPDPSNPGKTEAKVIVKYKDGTTQGTNDKPVVIPVEVHKNIIPEAPGGQKPKDALDNYVKVIFKAGKGGTVSGDLVYYVSPEVEVDMTESAGKITKTPSVGYTENGGTWSPEIKSEKITTEKTYEYNFVKSKDIVEKTDDSKQVIPEGYVKVTFKTEDANKGKLDGNIKEKIYYVNPKAEIKLVELADGKTAGEKQLAVPKTDPAANYVFDKWYEEIDTNTAITSERIYVAKFRLAKVTLTYDAGEGTGTVPEVVTVDHGTKVRLARSEGLTKENATFAGWKIGDTTYQAGDQVTLNENTTATAQWTTAKHTVTFNTMGGSNVPSQEVVHGGKLTNVTTPTLNDKVFMGWKEKETDTTYFDLNSPINENKTLIAIWQDPVQKINDGDLVEEQFIKVTFLKGAHGTLKDGQASNLEKVTYKVAKGMKLEDAKGIVPEIVPEKYYKSKSENDGWDKALDLTLATGETEKVFTAQYEPKEDVIPVEPGTSDEDIKKEIPDDMILVEFVVPKDKAFMTGNTKFYVKRDKLVDIETPVVHPLTLADGKENDYEFKGWNFKKDSTGKYLFKFKQNTQIGDGNFVKPEITIRDPKPNAKNVIIKDLTAQATGYLEIYRGTNPPVYVESSSRGRLNLFKIPDELGGKLDKNDRIRIYSKLNGVESDIREYRVR
ncbi:InlB B-repeat-containing protein, partial [Peptostreptococcus anaerobius]|uniref:InlB B-repeat-containing protein n=1 Tax=Peptostreptococcus anaerobius TaxID=1261 RepID=UPI00079167FE